MILLPHCLQYSECEYKITNDTIYVGEKVTVKATADEVKILNKGTMIASHPRIYGRYQEQIKLDHYLELLLQKSRALGNTKYINLRCWHPFMSSIVEA